MESLTPLEGSSRVRLEFVIPARGLIGLRSHMLTQTRGEAIYSSSFKGYIPYQGKRYSRINGALIADRAGKTAEYGLFGLQSRGRLFIASGTSVYEGMVFGENNKDADMNCNPTLAKKLTNMRASGSDDTVKLIPPTILSLEQCLSFITDSELIECTPKAIRMRKKILSEGERKRAKQL